MRIRLTFQGWILLGCVLVVLVTLVFVAGYIQGPLREQMVNQIRDALRQQVVLLREIVADRWSRGDTMEATDSLADHLGAQLSMRVTLIAPDGRVMGDSQVPLKDLARLENHASRPEVAEALTSKEGWSLRHSATLGVGLLYVAGRLGPAADPQLIIRLAIPLAEVERTIARLRGLILGASLLGIVLAVGVAYLVSRGISHPVKELTRNAQRIASGDLSPRLRRYPGHEIGELGRAFDQMTDHLQQEIQAVSQARDRMEAILRGMVEGVMLTDREGRILLANRALRELLDLEIDHEGRTPSEVLRSAGLQEAIQRVLEGTSRVSTEIRTLGTPQRVLHVHVVGLAGEGPQAGAVAVFHDITERKRLEDVRRDFVANVSHELRTPLTAIRGAVETLLNGALENPEYARHFAEVIQRHVGRLQRLLDDLLDLARIESKEAAPHLEPIEPTELGDAVLATVAELAESRGVELLRDLPREPTSFRGDRRQLEQALVNLMDNAIKYTEAGGQVTLGVLQQGREVCLLVSDTGMGIHPDHLPRIFERFYRVDKARSRELGGTGLGLAIVKHIAQAHRGRVEVESFPGQGSTFRIILPA